jgi:pyruvate/2-oxoglutarate dehydrogenase complex dihydrolipoamide dehydrogenase (E3) component
MRLALPNVREFTRAATANVANRPALGTPLGCSRCPPIKHRQDIAFMADLARSDRYCVIGAGASGLAIAKNFKERGIPFDCLEREADLGGLWNIATNSGIVYETTHLVSASYSTGYDDLPMGDETYPAYPSHERVLTYFREYVEMFGFADDIEFGKNISRVAARDDKLWEVSVVGEQRPRIYRGVVLANGHHDAPRMPKYPGKFAGEIIHSRQYRSPRQLRDKRILVVGCGNSAADIVSDAVHGSSRVLMSLRRGYWFVPKFMLGFPTHDVVSWVEFFPLPRLLKPWLFQASLWVLQGPPSRYLLPDPDYSIDQAHPTMSDEIPRLSAHGRITVKPEIARYDGNRVVFKDGSSETADMIIFATGYEPVVPFVDEDLVYDAGGRSRFYLRVVHPEHPGLFAAGLVQANGSMWRLADYQGQLIANLIIAEAKAPERAKRFRAGMSANDERLPPGMFLASDRHRLEANYYDYRQLLKRHIRRFGPVRNMRLQPVGAGRAQPSKARRSEPAEEMAS